MSKPKAKILIVEDSHTDLDILVNLLRDYDVMVALDGQTALELLARECPDVILLDIVIPGIDGFELCERIKSQKDLCEAPILFITGKTDEPSIIRAFDIGGSDYVTKPFRSKELLARVRMHVEYSRAMNKLRTMAVTDALTGLPNRHAFFTGGIALLDKVRALDTPLTAMMMDIDHFKKINDRCGHATGDDVLRKVSQTIRGYITERDLCARMGGEEFALLTPGLEPLVAFELADQIRIRLPALEIDSPQGLVRATVSIGVSSLDPETESLDQLLAQADNQLYKAKRSGRNRVCAATGNSKFEHTKNHPTVLRSDG
jgi:two-component system, cell cycle response regulator